MRLFCTFVLFYTASYCYDGLTFLDSHRIINFFEKSIKYLENFSDVALAVKGMNMMAPSKLSEEVLRKDFCSKLSQSSQRITKHLSSWEVYLLFDAIKILECRDLSIKGTDLSSFNASKSTSFDRYYYMKAINISGQHNVEQAIHTIKSSKSTDPDSIEGLVYELLMVVDFYPQSVSQNEIIQKIHSFISPSSGFRFTINGNPQLTSLFIYSLSTIVEENTVIDDDVFDGLVDYILSRKDSSDVKTLVTILVGLENLSQNQKKLLVNSFVEYEHVIQNDEMDVKLQIYDVYGVRPVTNLVMPRVTSISCDGTVMTEYSQESVLKFTDGSYFLSLNSIHARHSSCSINLDYKSKDYSIVVHGKNAINLKFLYVIEVDSVLFKVFDKSLKKQKPQTFSLEMNSKLPLLDLNQDSRITASFSITNRYNNRQVKAHQVFFQFKHDETHHIATFIAESDESLSYVCDIDLVNVMNSSFQYLSGTYEFNLVIGDFKFFNTFIWNFGNVKFSFPNRGNYKKYPLSSVLRPISQPKLTQKIKQPFVLLSFVFCCFQILLVVGLFVMWSRIGLHISAPISLRRMLFYLSFTGLFGSLFYYWVALNAFQALQIYIPIAIFTCFTLNRVLANDEKKDN